MKLNSAHVTNFRSAEDSELLSMEQVTCLVGKNESGKSAILLALAALNPHPLTPVTLDKERDYPRRYLTEYKTRHPKEEAVAVTTTWELEPKDLVPVEAEFGKGVLKENKATILRCYESTEAEWNVSIDLQKAFDNLLTTGGFDEAQLAALRSAKNVTELGQKLASVPETPKQKVLLDRVKGYKTVTSRVIDLLRVRLRMHFSEQSA